MKKLSLIDLSEQELNKNEMSEIRGGCAYEQCACVCAALNENDLEAATNNSLVSNMQKAPTDWSDAAYNGWQLFKLYM